MGKPFSAMFSASAAPIVPSPINPMLACVMTRPFRSGVSGGRYR